MSEDYFGDVVYWTWRSGGNPDLVDRDRVAGAEQEGYWPEDAAASEVRRQHRRAVEQDIREWEANEWDLPDDERLER